VSGSILGNVHVAIDVYHNNWKDLNDGKDWGGDRGGRPKQAEAAVPMPDAPSVLLQQRPGRQSSQFERNNEAIREAFREAVAPIAKSTVRVLIDGKPAMLGTIVAADGLIVTKATALTGKVSCKLPGGEVVEAKKLGEDKECDLALLQVEAKGLTPIKWAKDVTLQGNLVTAAGEDGKALAIGMVTSEPRQFRVASRPAGGEKRGYLGISTSEAGKEAGVKIEAVRGGTPAEKSGLKVGDVITKVGEVTVKTTDNLTQALRKYLPDQKVDVVVKRGDKSQTISLTLGKPPTEPDQNREPYDRWGGGPFSEKRFGYPKVLPHDTVLRPGDCGGPLVDTSGRAVGLNVSRSLRISTYALLPADVDRVVAKLIEARKADDTKKPERERPRDKK
jgi:serine protease Do